MQIYFYHYLLIAVFGAIAFCFACTPLLMAWFLAPKKPGLTKQENYECGIESRGNPWLQFKVQYYLYALVFVIFDIEMVFLYPWAAAFTGVGPGGFAAMAVFILVLAESLVYLWLKGVLEWN